MNTPATAVLASVFDDDGTSIGFVPHRGLAGYEGFTADEQSIGIFETARQAANALLIEEGRA